MDNPDLLAFEQELTKMPPIFSAAPKDPEQQRNVAYMKRLIELYLHDPDFRQQFNGDAAATLARYQLPLGVEEAQLFLDPNFAQKIAQQKFEDIPLKLRQYYAFYVEKLKWRNDSQRTLCAPTNKAFHKWRQKQVNRCWGEFNGININFIHVPLVFELSLGCSVGCPFCALASDTLRAIFRATEENLALWREVLTISREIVGPAAGEGVLYFASEPLDNPDYEAFAAIYAELLGHAPQITTAVAMRNPERTKKIITANNEQQRPMLHRFSVLDLETYRQICAYFTPEELLYVEVLARYDESLSNVITKAGRSLEESTQEQSIGSTISCASGFIVNMAEHSIRLSTPCNASAEHPTGEIVCARVHFTDAADFRAQLLQIIKEQMPLTLDIHKVLQLQPFYTLEPMEHGFKLTSSSGFKVSFNDEQQPQHFYQPLGNLLAQGTRTAFELASQINEQTQADPAVIFTFLRYLDNAGVLL